MRRGWLLAVIMLAWAAAPARALDLPVAVPGESVQDMALSGDHLVAAVIPQSLRGIVVRTSHDGGRTFHDVWVAPEGESVRRVGLDPDGTAWLTTGNATELALRKLPVDGAAGARAPLGTGVRDASETAVVGARRVLVVRTDAGLELRTVGDDGTSQALHAVGSPGADAPEIVRDANGATIESGSHSWRIGEDGATGGDLGPHTPVPPDGTMLLGGTVYAPVGPGIWHPVDPGVGMPFSPRFETDGRQGLLFYRNSRPVSSAGEVPAARRLESFEPPTSLGALRPDTARMIARANAIRAEQGLPPLLGDPGISVASLNHARYNDRWGEAHNETAGRQGFTGVTSSSRCAAVGVACGGEILYTGVTGDAAVDGWYTTPFHRNIVGGPADWIAGAASSENSAVMNDATTRGLVTVPIGLPRGTWSGPLSFGGETPDPGEPCGLTAPYGTAITAYRFTDPVTGDTHFPTAVALADGVTGQAVPGCTQSKYFLPAQALTGHRKYLAYATYAGIAGPVSWTFTTTGDSEEAPDPGTAPAGCRPSAGAAALLRRRQRLRVSVTACQTGSVAVELRQRGRVLARRSRRIAAGATARVRLPGARGLRRGRARVVVRFGSGSPVRLSVRVR